MAGYDPQARRTRPSVIGDSPVDDLLGHLPLAPVGQAADSSDRRDPPVARAVPDTLPAGRDRLWRCRQPETDRLDRARRRSPTQAGRSTPTG